MSIVRGRDRERDIDGPDEVEAEEEESALKTLKLTAEEWRDLQELKRQRTEDQRMAAVRTQKRQREVEEKEARDFEAFKLARKRSRGQKGRNWGKGGKDGWTQAGWWADSQSVPKGAKGGKQTVWEDDWNPNPWWAPEVSPNLSMLSPPIHLNGQVQALPTSSWHNAAAATGSQSVRSTPTWAIA